MGLVSGHLSSVSTCPHLALKLTSTMAFTSRQSRHPEIIPPSLTISSFPLPPSTTSPTPTPTLHHLLRLLLPSTAHLNFPVNLHSWDDPAPTKPVPESKLVHFAPHSENEDLHSGVLQLPAGTVLTVLEANVREGSWSIACTVAHPRN